jgi:ADP-ribose pyrophosphatase YjhB (NUDIX family)
MNPALSGSKCSSTPHSLCNMPSISTMPPSFQSYKPRSQKVVGAICINENNEVLLVRGRTTQKWSFPKGHIKQMESDLECARRELKEETGICAPLQYLSYHKLKAASYYTFAIESMPLLEIHDNWEVDAVTWWPMHSLPEKNANIDVSIIRTLMKSIRSRQNIHNYINSSYAHKKIANIKKSIEENSSTPRNIPCSTLANDDPTPIAV